MAWEFANMNVATIKGNNSDGDKITVAGVTTANITPTFAAEQINKILDIGGKAIIIDEEMTRTQVEEAQDNG